MGLLKDRIVNSLIQHIKSDQKKTLGRSNWLTVSFDDFKKDEIVFEFAAFDPTGFYNKRYPLPEYLSFKYSLLLDDYSREDIEDAFSEIFGEIKGNDAFLLMRDFSRDEIENLLLNAKANSC